MRSVSGMNISKRYGRMITGNHFHYRNRMRNKNKRFGGGSGSRPAFLPQGQFAPRPVGREFNNPAIVNAHQEILQGRQQAQNSQAAIALKAMLRSAVIKILHYRYVLNIFNHLFSLYRLTRLKLLEKLKLTTPQTILPTEVVLSVNEMTTKTMISATTKCACGKMASRSAITKVNSPCRPLIQNFGPKSPSSMLGVCAGFSNTITR